MYDEGSLRPISALQHLIFCERQCALIHNERLWADNVLTVEGSLLHQNVDQKAPRHESRGDLRLCRALELHSFQLGLFGIADTVELHRDAQQGVRIPGVRGLWRPVPIEWKRGRVKLDAADRVQLCAQALCLEEMLGTRIPAGVLFYAQTHRRYDVEFDEALREQTAATAARLHELLTAGTTPAAVREKKCDRCSLFELCRPDLPERDVWAYLKQNGLGGLGTG